VSGAPVLDDVETFLYREAELLGRAALDEWIGLFTDDGLYWMPVDDRQSDGKNHISIFHDDRTLMEIRAAHMAHPDSPSKMFALRLSHIIGNVRIESFDSEESLLETRANFHCLMFYRDSQEIFAGTYQHRIVTADDDWRIKMKTVRLINCDASHRSIHTYI
jgi:benzoate/toluate 1,2-dioxygenase beta subunit